MKTYLDQRPVYTYILIHVFMSAAVALPDCPANCDHCRVETQCIFCATGFYGQQCEEQCSDRCKYGCVLTTGHCYTCYPGWTGVNCDEEVTNEWAMDSFHILAVTCTGSAMLIVAIICVCFFKRRHHRRLVRNDIQMGFVPRSQNLISNTNFSPYAQTPRTGSQIRDRNLVNSYETDPPPYPSDGPRPLPDTVECTPHNINRNVFLDVTADIGPALPPEDGYRDSTAPPPSYHTLFPQSS